jgi:DNA invertase Pin-like site-specific DNA recombinase
MKRATVLAIDAPPLKRCAIYTRKSTTMGLEQEFNSLDAQREACEAYVRSQAGAGWQGVDAHYDDGGFTGANIDRPAFQRLLADIDADRIDVVVVYKLDRVSRSLLDFATVMKRLNDAGVSFVSVTQNFSTTDAVGRMTLNLLATFAEFEREQIAERTRDKMAASRRRGKWTGGPVPLGYSVSNKKLVVDELEVVAVREVFDLYLEQRSVIAVAGILNKRGRTTKRHLATSGRMREGRPWSKTDVARVLKSAVYAGYISYGAELHEGEHQPIVDRETFQAVGALLASAGGGNGTRYRNPDYLLGGLLFCSHCGSALTAASTTKGSREYRYYRCVKRDKQGRAACPTKQVSAPRIEQFVAERLRDAIAEADLAGALVAGVNERLDGKRRELEIEHRRLPSEIASLSAEGKRLVDKVGEVAPGAQRLLDKKLEEVGTQLQRLERRLADAERELAALDATQVEAKWIGQCLRDFDAVYDVMTSENRSRLFRAVIERVDYESSTGEVRVTLADLTSETTEATKA